MHESGPGDRDAAACEPRPSTINPMRSPADAASVALTWATWSSVFHWYRVVDWYDTAVHFVTPGTVAVTLQLLLARARLLPSPRDGALRRSAVPLITTALGATVASLWEMYEWLATDVFGAHLRVGYEDTVADMAAGVAGSLAAGLILAWRSARASPRPSEDGDL